MYHITGLIFYLSELSKNENRNKYILITFQDNLDILSDFQNQKKLFDIYSFILEAIILKKNHQFFHNYWAEIHSVFINYIGSQVIVVPYHETTLFDFISIQSKPSLSNDNLLAAGTSDNELDQLFNSNQKRSEFLEQIDYELNEDAIGSYLGHVI